jgi:hypothetical protein
VTSPDSVGQASVEITADLKKFAAGLKAQVESAFKGLDFDRLIRESIGNKPIKIPVQPEVDGSALPKGGPKQKVPVEVDPLFDQFRAELRRQSAALAKEIHANIPVDADTDGLRAELGGQLAEIAKQLKLPIPAEPADKAAFQAKLQEQLREVSERVKAEVTVEPEMFKFPSKIKETRLPKLDVEVDPVLGAFQAAIRSQVAALARAVNAKIPIGADTAELRADLSAQLAALRESIKIDVPTEPGDRAEYEARLKAQLAEVSARVKQSIKVEPKVDSPDLSGLAGLPGKLTPNFLGGGAISGIATLVQGLGDSVAKFAASAAAGGSQLAASIGSAAGPIAAVVGGLLAAQAAVVALGFATTLLVPALAAAAGAAAAIPAALTGLGAVGGTLLLGFKGISDAFKPKAAGGGGGAGQNAAQQARQIASASRQVEAARRGITAANRAYESSERSLAAAERGVASAQQGLVDAEAAVADAQKRAQQAQVAVNKARSDAVDDLIDMNLQLKDSKLSEQEASLAVTDALRDLNAVKLTGNIPDIQKADLAYQRAQLTLEESTQSTKELSATTADANAKGVEGSDKVQSALQDQASALDGVKKAQQGVVDAQNGIIDAADSLKSAQDGVLSAADGIKSAQDSLASATDSLAQAQTKQAAGAAAAAQQITKLAPSATAFVNALKALKPAFEDLRLDVQQRLFAGLDQTVTNLGTAWIPALKVTLGSYADTFNGFFKNLGASLGTPKFISDIQTGAEGARQGLDKIFTSITTSLVPAFGTLSAAAGPFLSKLGGEIADIVTQFGNWIDKVSKPGPGGSASPLQTFFERAGTALHDIFNTGKLVVRIGGQIIGILIGTQPTKGKTPLDSFNDGLQTVSNWLADPTHQQQIADFVTDLKDGFKKFTDAVAAVKGFLDTISGQKGNAHSAGYDIGSAIVAGVVAGFLGAMKSSLFTFFEYFSPLGPLIAIVKGALGIHSPSTVFMEIGGQIVDGLLGGLTFDRVTQKMGQLFGVVTGPLSDAGSWLVSHGQNLVIGLGNGIAKQVGNLQTRAGQLKTTVQNKLSDAGSWLSTHGGNAVLGLVNGISGQLGYLGAWVRNVPVTVENKLLDAGSWLYQHGRAVISGLIQGIQSALGGLGSFLGGIGTYIQDHKGPLPKDAKLLVPAGQAIMGGLIDGISDRKSDLASELADVTSVVTSGLAAQGDQVRAAADEIAAKAMPQIPDATFGLGAMADAKLSASLSASSQQQVLLSWAPNATGDQVLKAFQPLINTTYGGSVTRAFTGS